MSNEAFSRVKLDTLLAARIWDALDTSAMPFEVNLPEGISERVRRRHIATLAAAEKNFEED